MNASAPVRHTPVPRRRATARSIAWYAALILFPVLIALCLFTIRHLQRQQLAQRNVQAYGTVPEFRLTNQDGVAFGSAELKGRIWIASFIFTTCPGPCPIISSRMAETQRPLENSNVQLVSFTVDPETDTPPVLRDYATRLNAQTNRWNFLTGGVTEIYGLIRNGFKLAVSDGAEAEGQPIHATRAVLVDRRGTIRGYYDMIAPDGVNKLLADTTNLLREQPR